MPIKNVVFDVGNVLVNWDPHQVIQSVFPESDPIALYQQMRPVWIDLNLGKLTEKEAIEIYDLQLNLPQHQLANLMHRFKTSQTPIQGTMQLLQNLHQSGINLYAITDNIKEFIDYHRSHSTFLEYFLGIVVSADIGVLKPNAQIYRHLINQHQLNPAESVFIDDIPANVKGAQGVGMHGFVFTNPSDCCQQLKTLGVPL